jgi:hypothetical protein
MLTNMKRNLGLLLAVATLSAVTALVPSTAGAAPSIVPNANTVLDPGTTPTDQETYKACPTGSAAAAGFTDTTSTDVDCIKMFGVTTGKTATTYDPTGTISRQDMARFIHRMFVPTGVAAAGATAVPAFTDIAGVDAGGTAAINALASHGITLGTTATTFSPDDNVTRAQMAMFLNRFASIVKDHAGVVVVAIPAATGEYNYSDIAGASWEGMESIIRLFNLGVTDGNCLAAACPTTYRPSDDITRAEMASMLTNLLNHTNARPAGVTIQALQGFATAGAKTTLISARNADFTANINAQIDHFYDPTQLTTARALAANTPFTAILNTVSASVTSAAGTAGTIDPLDPTTDTYGNVAGAGLTTAVNSTTTWWAWTATGGSIYIDGTTAGVAKIEAVMGAASTTVYADTTTVTISGSNALGKALAEDLSGAHTSVIANDGIKTMAGTSRTITATMTNSTLTTAGTAHTVVDGYTFKFSDLKVDMLGNVTITNTYVPSSNGAASYVVTCGADNSASVNGDAAVGYWESHEVTITEATALGTAVGVSRPAAAATVSTDTYTLPTDGGDSASANISCDDEVRAYTAGTTGNTLSVSTNNAVVSTAGTLVAVTTTAYDQYGDGIAGVKSRIDKGGVQQAILTSQSNGVATLNTVLCTANGIAAFATNLTSPAVMTTIGISTPTNLIEGTTVYCATAGTDTSYGAVADARESQTITMSGAADAGQLTCTYTNPTSGVAATTALIEHDGNATAWTNAFNGLANLLGAAVTLSGAGAEVATLQFAANTGNHAPVTCEGTSGTDLIITSGTVAVTLAVATTVAGGSLSTLDFVDDDPTANTFVTVRVLTQANSVGTSATTTTYHVWDWDSTDVFMLDATHAQVATTVDGASEAQWEAELKSLTDQTVNMTLSERDGALTTGISVWRIGL